ncbi:MAG: hypothetical protein ACXVCF_17405, partial [Isosphaeraceae bacterium]
EEREELASPHFEVDGVYGGRGCIALREAGEGELSLADKVGHQVQTRDGEWRPFAWSILKTHAMFQVTSGDGSPEQRV